MRRLAGAFLATTLLIVAVPSPTLAGDGTFPNEPLGSPFGGESESIALGDFNSDGNLDYASGGLFGDSGAEISHGIGDGRFSSQGHFAPGSNAIDIEVGDFNDDGNEDLVFANFNGVVRVGLGTEAGLFPQTTTHTFLAGTRPRDIGVGDFNSDGIEDLAFADAGIPSTPGGIPIRLGAGDGTFPTVPPGSAFPAGDGPNAITVDDFDGDGAEDLAAIDFGSEEVTVRLGAGDGTFAAEPPGSPFGSGVDPQALSTGDFNQDGNEDLAIANDFGPDAGVTVRLGAGDGTFSAPPGSPFDAGLNPVDLAVGDFNSDRLPDIAVANFGDAPPGNVPVLLGTGDGTFTIQPPGSPFSAGQRPLRIAVGDFDNDAIDDLAITDLAGSGGFGDVRIRLGGGLPPLHDSLLAQGGVEGPGAARTLAQSPPPPAPWARSGQMTYLRYGAEAGLPRHVDSPKYLTGGLNSFWGGPAAADSSASQETVSLAGSGGSIDAGFTTAELSGYLGGYRTENDRMTATAVFENASGAPIGSLTIGPVTAADRNNRTVLLARRASATLPAGTRRIEVRLDAAHSFGATNDALADNVKLTVTPLAPPRSQPPVKPPAARPQNQERPKIKGKRRPGKRLRCDPGAWTGNPSFEFAWLRKGARIKRAADRKYKVKRKDVSKPIRCRVTATNTGGSTSAVSERVKPKPKKRGRKAAKASPRRRGAHE